MKTKTIILLCLLTTSVFAQKENQAVRPAATKVQSVNTANATHSHVSVSTTHRQTATLAGKHTYSNDAVRNRSFSKENQQPSISQENSTNSSTDGTTNGQIVFVNSNNEDYSAITSGPAKNNKGINRNPCDCEGKILITPSMLQIYSSTQIFRMLQSGEYCLSPTLIWMLRLAAVNIYY